MDSLQWPTNWPLRPEPLVHVPRTCRRTMVSVAWRPGTRDPSNVRLRWSWTCAKSGPATPACHDGSSSAASAQATLMDPWGLRPGREQRDREDHEDQEDRDRDEHQGSHGSRGDQGQTRNRRRSKAPEAARSAAGIGQPRIKLNVGQRVCGKRAWNDAQVGSLSWRGALGACAKSVSFEAAVS